VAFILVASATCALAAACGLDVEGEQGGPGRADGGGGNGEASLPDGRPLEDAEIPIDAPDDGDGGGVVKKCEEGCGDAGGGCDGGTCVVTCTGNNSCDAGVTCPPGVPCVVTCATNGSCPAAIDCSQAQSCVIQCNGDRSCHGVKCAGSTCSVDCKGGDSCGDAGVTCTATETCSVSCGKGGACAGPTSCTSKSCAIDCKNGTCLGDISIVADASRVSCGDNACTGVVGCSGATCDVSCKQGCNVCCDAGTCLQDAAGAPSCP
jgi:hypothetical protein